MSVFCERKGKDLGGKRDGDLGGLEVGKLQSEYVYENNLFSV